MEKLDQLIAKFKEAKEELEKNSSPLHNTVEGFMTGLKAHPKGSPERGEFITNHLAHGPFKDALNAHPQGKQVHDTLQAARAAHLKSKYAQQGDAGVKAQYGQLNSKANAGLAGPMKINVGDAAASFKKSELEKSVTLTPNWNGTHSGQGNGGTYSVIKRRGPMGGVNHHVSFHPHGNTNPMEIHDLGAHGTHEAAHAAVNDHHSRVGARMGKSIDDELDDLLEKAYISPWYTHGPSKKVAPAAKPTAKPAKLTGIDKIKAVSKETIHPTSIVSEDQKRAKAMGAPTNPTSPNKPAKLTGLDRIKAESMKPITPTTVKKDEDVEEKVKKSLEEVKKNLGDQTGKMKGSGLSTLTHPNDTSRANMFSDAMSGAYQSKLAAPAAPAKKLTGMDRIRAASQEPLKRSEKDMLKQETEDKKHINAPFGKTINSSYASPTNSSGMAMSADEKLTLNKGGQWDLAKDVNKKPVFGNQMSAPAGIGHTPGPGATYGAGGYQITTARPALKPAAAGMNTIGPTSPTPNQSSEDKTRNELPEKTIADITPTKLSPTKPMRTSTREQVPLGESTATAMRRIQARMGKDEGEGC